MSYTEPVVQPIPSTHAKIRRGLVTSEMVVTLLVMKGVVNDPAAIHAAQIAKEKVEKEQSKSIHAQNKYNQQKIFSSKHPQNSKVKAEDHRRQNGNGNHYKHRR
jgi:hypothetical protein